MYVMYDSITLNAIPASAPVVAGYVGGRWPTWHAVVDKFPKARHVSIAIAAFEDADVLDCEPGDASPEQVVEWVTRQLRRGVARPVVYASASAMPDVAQRLGAAGLRDKVGLWTAHYSHVPHICGHGQCEFNSVQADGTQWTDKALGRNLDESLLSDGFFVGKPALAHDPIGYQKFPNTVFQIGNRLINEQITVLVYDDLRRHPFVNRSELASIRNDLELLAGRVAQVTLDQGRDKEGHLDWRSWHRGWRYQQLLGRSRGKRYV